MSKQTKLEINIDDSEVLEMLKDFQGKDAKAAIRTALRRSGNKIAKSAKRNLRSRVRNANKRNPKYKDKMINAIRNKVLRKSNGDYFFKTHTMGTRKTGSGTYRARFFETGTKVRKKDGHNRGSIKSVHFFRDAYVGREKEVLGELDKELKIAIVKINNKYKNKKQH